MKVRDAADHFGGMSNLARTCRITRQAVYAMEKKDPNLPELWARRLHDLTGGELRFDPGLYRWQERDSTFV